MVKVFENGVEQGLWTDYIPNKILTIKKEKAPSSALIDLYVTTEVIDEDYWTHLGTINDIRIDFAFAN